MENPLVIRQRDLVSLNNTQAYLESTINIDAAKLSGGFPHINDEGFESILENLATVDIKSSKARVAIIIGSGSVLSSLPDIPADVIIMIDVNARVLQWMQKALNAFKESTTPEEYSDLIYSHKNPLFQDKDYLLRKKEKRILGRKDLCFSQERFNLCKSALEEKMVLIGQIDVSDEHEMQKLADVLKEDSAEITYANFTNVMNYTDDITSILKLLPYNENAVIVISKFSKGLNPGPFAEIVEGGISALKYEE